MHMVPLHVPDVQLPPGQHASPGEPHRVHCSVDPTVVQARPVPLHVLPGQHGSPSSPHDSQKPPVDGQTCWMVPMGAHVPPTATHWLGVAESSQHPPVQVPLQHGSPGPPQD